jgi:hypothetical protein
MTGDPLYQKSNNMKFKILHHGTCTGSAIENYVLIIVFLWKFYPIRNLVSWSRGEELDCRSLGRGFEPWPMSGTPFIMHRSCPDNWLAQFSINNVHKGGLKQYSYRFYLRCTTAYKRTCTRTGSVYRILWSATPAESRVNTVW